MHTHMGVTVEDVEAIHHLLCTGPAPYVQEVGWLTIVQLDDIHCSHGQPSSVHWGRKTQYTLRTQIHTIRDAQHCLQTSMQ